MEKKVAVVCGLAGFLGLLSAALAFAAEATRIRASDVKTKNPDQCIYPKSPAVYLGLFSALAIAMALVVINFVTGCVFCKRNSNHHNTDRTVALISFVVSWVTFVIAFLLLLTGSALNDQKGMEKMYLGNYCYVLKPGVFSGGAFLSLASVSLGIIYYLALQKPKSLPPWNPPHNQGIALGMPQIPPLNENPVFVHEDTYYRQQVL
ncbi:uncharacterized protein LOC110033943 [Phalaenopsis equestris]|uniref:uncharacterized protein LOC110033943 n=1 Tax=Phalaenopsis equestris TaxID=78828 RepID=UPI0009E1DDE5|nr:uncharacterized protein LOC110033943 [Phalaenopsis equestris]